MGPVVSAQLEGPHPLPVRDIRAGRVCRQYPEYITARVAVAVAQEAQVSPADSMVGFASLAKEGRESTYPSHSAHKWVMRVTSQVVVLDPPIARTPRLPEGPEVKVAAAIWDCEPAGQGLLVRQVREAEAGPLGMRLVTVEAAVRA